MTTFTISQAAHQLGVSAHTLRYYERAGLIGPIERSGSGHRRYSVEDLERLRFLHCLRETEMPIRRIADYSRLSRAGGATLRDRVELLNAHRVDLDGRIQELHRLWNIVDAKIERLECAWLVQTRAPGGTP